MPGITAAAFISGNIDTDFTFVIESPLLVTIGFAANGTGQGAGILIVHGYTTYSHLRFEFISGDKSSQGDKEREEYMSGAHYNIVLRVSLYIQCIDI